MELLFDNTIKYMSVGPGGEIISQGFVKNALGQRTKDAIMRALTNPSGNTAATAQLNYLYFRLDNLTDLSTAAGWIQGDTSGTVKATRYSNSTYVSQVLFDGTYTATAAVNCKSVFLTDTSVSGVTDVGSFARFYSTSLSMSAGSGGKLIIQWTVTI